jgi:ribosomal protein S18 acetylase RimI-like enzyme
MNIRLATQEDIPRCSEILNDSKLGRTYYPNSKVIKYSLSQALKGDYIYVSEDEMGKVTGFIWFTLKGAFASYPYAHIMCVDKAYRSMGIGKRLLEFYEQCCLKKTKKLVSKAYLVVADFNERAYNFYVKKGYKQVATLDSLFKNNVTEKLMCKEINQNTIHMEV